MTDQKKHQIAIIDRRLEELQQVINSDEVETKKTIEKRDRLNGQCRVLRHEIDNLRVERDNLNERVQTLKILREELRERTKKLVDEKEAISERISCLRKKTPRRGHLDLQKELDEVEWKIQTTSLDADQEKELIGRVKELESQLHVYRKIEKQKKKTLDMRDEINAMRRKADEFHNELSTAAHQSQEIHQRMMLKIDEAKTVKAEADNLHLAYIRIKEKADPARDEWRNLVAERKKLKDLLRQEEEAVRKTKAMALKEKLGSEARNKLHRGEKLSWDEFQLLDEPESQT